MFIINKIINFFEAFKPLYLSKKFYYIWVFFLFVLFFGYWFPQLFYIGKYLFLIFAFLAVADAYYLLAPKRIIVSRNIAGKLSNGDPNPVSIEITNFYPYKSKVEIIDELPFQFQKRDFKMEVVLSPGESKKLKYYLKPVSRGIYQFGKINAFISSSLGLVKLRCTFESPKEVKVYPGYIQMKKHELIALTKHRGAGLKKIRKLGHSLEFEQIKQYNKGDDFRTINWKATAKHNKLMVNQYQDQTSQNIYSVIDMGRSMKMPFEQMTLLDYAINSSLSFSNIVIKKHDKAGILTFERDIRLFQKSDNKKSTLPKIFENLFHLKTGFYEADYEKLYKFINKKIPNRSLLMLYTNFEHYSSFQRQMPFLVKMAKKHLLVVIIFENTELEQLTHLETEKPHALYSKILAEDNLRQKRRMIKEMNLHKIHAILTKPEDLSMATINKYLELKNRGLI